jgi:CDP-glucose 4,6-dehydratase
MPPSIPQSSPLATATPSDWRDTRVFVTGATGLVGSWLVQRLLDAGAEVVCLVRDVVPRSSLLESGALARCIVVRGDVTDQALLERALGEYEISTVFHLAAQTVVGVANRNPVSTFESNIAGTWSLLEACRRSPLIESIVVASSDKAYGDQPILPYNEETPLQGRHPYDVSKSCTDLIATSYAHTYDLPIVITRCGNFFGGGDLNWNRLVPGVIRDVRRGRSPVIRSDGTHVRDYLYVEDGAAAYMLLAARLKVDRHLRGRAYNISADHVMSARVFAERLVHAMGESFPLDIRAIASGEIHEQRLDSSRARREVGWKPDFDLDTAVARTIDWYDRHFASDASRDSNHTPLRRSA